jgi:hypothetical protein
LTHYETLGVNPRACLEEIRHAYHCQAQELHPDRHPDVTAAERHRLEDRMAEVNAAWAVLEHPDSRRAYDAALRRHGPGRPTPRPRRVRSPTARRPVPHPPETPPQLLRRKYFIDLAQPHVSERVLVADAYERCVGDPYGGSLGLTIFAVVKGLALYRTMLLAITPGSVVLLAARSGWSGWRVKEVIGAWPRADVTAEAIEPDLSIRLRRPGHGPLELSPLWVTPEAAEIRRLLT